MKVRKQKNRLREGACCFGTGASLAGRWLALPYKEAIVNIYNHITTDGGKVVGGQVGIPILILSFHLDGSETVRYL